MKRNKGILTRKLYRENRIVLFLFFIYTIVNIIVNKWQNLVVFNEAF